MSRWSLRRRLTVAIAALAVVLVALVTVAVILLLSVRSQQQAVIDRYFTAVSITNQRFIDQIDAETAVRGYALTDDPDALEPLRLLRSASYPAQAERLRGLLRGEPDVVAAFDAWEAASQHWYTAWARPTVAAIRRHGGPAVTVNDTLRGKQLFDANRTRLDGFRAKLVARRDAASNALRLRTDLLFGSVVLLAVALAALGAMWWWGLRRWVIAPLAALGAETRQVRAGALDHAVSVRGPAEIERLGVDIDEMRRDLVTQLAVVQGARHEVERAREVVEAQAKELERSNRDLEQFAYVASHDLQEPLRKVASFCQMLERRYAGQLDERADQYIAFAVDGAKRMQQLINDLLAFSRVGRVEGAKGDVDLQACLASALDNLALAIEASAARIDAEPLPRVWGEAGLLTQLLQNLVGNAIKFRGDAPPVVRITVAAAGASYEFACSDNGPGIEPRYAERIFVIFQRLHSKDEYTGTGIGLALCKRIVEHHGGRIWLDTSANGGATFRWTLPASAPAEPEPAVPVASVEAP